MLALGMYGSLSLTATSPPQSFVEPLGVDDVLSFLRADPSDSSEVSMMISAAREQAEIMQGRDLVVKQWDLSLDYWPGYQVELRDPLIGVDLVTHRDSSGTITTLTENTDFIVDTAKHPGIIIPLYGQQWPAFTPWPSSAVRVRFRSGLTYDDAWWLESGYRVRMGMKLLIKGWFDGDITFTTGPSAIAEYPFQITSCLSQGGIKIVR